LFTLKFCNIIGCHGRDSDQNVRMSERLKPPYKCSNCPEKSFTRKTSAFDHNFDFHDGMATISASDGQVVEKNQSWQQKSNQDKIKVLTVQDYLLERTREAARIDERVYRKMMRGVPPRHLDDLYWMAFEAKNMDQPLVESLFQDIVSGKAVMTLTEHILIRKIKLSIAEMQAKLEKACGVNGSKLDLVLLPLYIDQLQFELDAAESRLSEKRRIR
jgi:hypothetical protein